ncbi:hypothetical protein KY358_00785 [Candidatus Woesearchaeota archaeon]|nr:hypothetical protein [Candidatus Woesearchaeota archaeon]
MKWCLNKAKKEISEGKMHRGLVELKPDIEEAKNHLKKAEHNFKAVLSFQKTGFADWSVSAVFYTIYHCFLAIIRKFGYESRNQECTIALIEHLKEQNKIELSGGLIEALKASDHEERHAGSAIALRENFQYGTETVVEDDSLKELKELCKTSIEETKKIIY